MMAGQFNEIVKIYETVEEANDYGERIITQNLISTTRAKVEVTGGNRNTENNEIVFSHNKTFYVRFYVPVTDTSVIEFDSKKYRVLNVEKRKEYNDIKVISELINE